MKICRIHNLFSIEREYQLQKLYVAFAFEFFFWMSTKIQTYWVMCSNVVHFSIKLMLICPKGFVHIICIYQFRYMYKYKCVNEM